jgi:hypothetical protein
MRIIKDFENVENLMIPENSYSRINMWGRKSACDKFEVVIEMES